MRRLLSVLGSVLVVLVALSGTALVIWNVWLQGPYGDSCHYSLGCRSYYCLHHELRGSAQVPSTGTCTKSCESDADCGSGARCVVLGEAARDDLPRWGKPDKACMRQSAR